MGQNSIHQDMDHRFASFSFTERATHVGDALCLTTQFQINQLQQAALFMQILACGIQLEPPSATMIEGNYFPY